MKSTGMTRKIDELGRFVIPKEMRTQVGIAEKDTIEILVEGETIVLKKYVDDKKCVFCSSKDDIKPFKGKYICKDCIGEL